MEIKYYVGNLLDFTDVDIIGHQVNCQGVMGAGVAKFIKTEHPDAYQKYTDYIQKNNEFNNLLGTTLITEHSELGEEKLIAHLFGQNQPGPQTDYLALETALTHLKLQMEHRGLKRLGLPKIGCGIGGGDWNVVFNIIMNIFNYSTIDVTIFVYEP